MPIAEGQTISHKRPDGASIIPWIQGRNVAWELTVLDTVAAEFLFTIHTSDLAGAATDIAAELKNET